MERIKNSSVYPSDHRQQNCYRSIKYIFNNQQDTQVHILIINTNNKRSHRPATSGLIFRVRNAHVWVHFWHRSGHFIFFGLVIRKKKKRNQKMSRANIVLKICVYKYLYCRRYKVGGLRSVYGGVSGKKCLFTLARKFLKTKNARNDLWHPTPQTTAAASCATGAMQICEWFIFLY